MQEGLDAKACASVVYGPEFEDGLDAPDCCGEDFGAEGVSASGGLGWDGLGDTYKLIVAAKPGSWIFFKPPRIRMSSTSPLMCISLGFRHPYASSHCNR